MIRQSRSGPTQADLWFQQAFAAHNGGKVKEAQALYRRVLQKTPSDMETLYLLGTACSQLGEFEEAVRYLKKALALKPNHPEALNNLGLTLKKMGEPAEAAACYRSALQLKPDYADAHSNLGAALEQLREYEEAEKHLREALRLQPQLADAYYSLGLVLKAKDRFDEASQCFLQVIQQKPEFYEAWCDLGTIYKAWGRADDALACFSRAVECHPEYVEALHNLGAVLQDLGRFEEAGKAYDAALALDPTNIVTNWNKATFFLAQGILDKGWEAHEWRFNPKLAITLNRFPFPQWDGSSLEDKTILIYAEQGLGDEILFASCIPDVMARARHCVIECEPRLAPLFARSFPGATVIGAKRENIGWLVNAPRIDVQAAVGSLPRFLRPTLDSFPATPGYLAADPSRVAYWRERLAQSGDRLKVGICWRSSLRKGERHRLYSLLTEWGDIFKVQGVQFVNLQYDECSAEIREAEEKFGITIGVFPEVDLRNDIDETAALTSAMDLVISARTAVAEIAASLGVRTLRIDDRMTQWTSLGTDRMPWHPSLRWFKQEVDGDWTAPLSHVAAALKGRVAAAGDAIEYVEVDGGVALAVNGSPDDLATYVLKEQHRWFDQECKFVFDYVGHGMHVIDIGAGAGAYTVPLSKAIGGGKVVAFANVDDIDLLRKSRLHNRLEQELDIHLLERNLSLDAMDAQDFVRIAREACNSDLLARSAQFFAAHSPLVMFGIRPRTEYDVAVSQKFVECGYTLYKLVPGLGVLVPFVTPDELDSYALNLFACKPDRAALLEQKGILIRQPGACDALPSIDDGLWQTLLKSQPYARPLVEQWSAAAQKAPGWELYWMALHLYAISRDGGVDAARRYACLQAAVNIMGKLIQGQATILRLLSLCRMLTDLGLREAAVNLLNQTCALLGPALPNVLDEPVLVLDDCFSAAEVERVGDWIVAMVLQRREELRAFSTFFTGKESLQALQEIRTLGYGGDDIDRRIALIEARVAAS